MTEKKAPRNKTITLTQEEIVSLSKRTIKLNHRTPVDELHNKVIWQDTFKVLDFLPLSSIDLMIVDPPYNLTKNFGQSTFREMGISEYKNGLKNG